MATPTSPTGHTSGSLNRQNSSDSLDSNGLIFSPRPPTLDRFQGTIGVVTGKVTNYYRGQQLVATIDRNQGRRATNTKHRVISVQQASVPEATHKVSTTAFRFLRSGNDDPRQETFKQFYLSTPQKASIAERSPSETSSVHSAGPTDERKLSV